MTRTYTTRLTATLLLGALASPAALAQAGTADEVFLPQAGLTVSLTPLTREQAIDEVYVRLWDEDQAALDLALGRTDGNVALVRQMGSGNTVTADQAGARNLAVLVQDGTGNTADVSQIGDDNLFGATVTGDLNALDVTQRGDRNVYLLDFTGDRLDHTVVQDGDDLQLVQTGVAEAPFSVEQRGDGAALVIEHNGGSQ